MKLIQILGLVAAMSIAAGAQNAGTGNQTAGSTAQPKNTTDKSKQKSTGSPGSGKKPANAAGAQKPSAGTVQSGKIQITTTKASPKKGGPAGKSGAATAKQTPTGKGGAATPAGAGKTVKGAPPSSVVTKTAPSKGATGQAGKKSPLVAGPPASAKKKAAPAGAQKKKGPPATAAAAGKKKKETKPAEKKPVVAGKPGATTETKTPIRVATGRKRDPFVSPIRSSGGAPVGPTCSTGKRCLFIPELLVQGTVRDLNGKMVAVVTNRAHHTYFLRESDQVFNGSVQRITTDSVIFREYMTDNLGRETAHEVVKRVGGGGSS